MHRTLGFTLVVVLGAAPAAAQQWPGFRGPNASGIGVPTGELPLAWNLRTSRNVRWALPVPGLAHSSPIVWGDRIYVTTAVAFARTTEVLTLGDADAAGIESASDLVRHSWRVFAIDRVSGRVVWERAAHEGVPRVKRHVKSSHASATPATNGTYVVALFGSEGLFCYTADGTLLWKQDLGIMDAGFVPDPSYQWGPGSSPVIFENLVIVQNDRRKDAFVAAFDLSSGREVWRSSRDEEPSWSTPAMLVSDAGRGAILVTNSPKFIRGLDPRTGRELWRVADPDGQVKVVTPVAAGGLVIVTGGFPAGGRPIVALRADGTTAWRVETGSPYTPTPIVVGDVLYVLRDNGVLATYDAGTGAPIYVRRIAVGAGAFSASPVAADGKIYVVSEDGDVFVLRAGRTFELLAQNSMGQVCMATPAIAGGMLLVRTRSTLYALGRP